MSNLKWFSGGDDRSKRAEIIITELLDDLETDLGNDSLRMVLHTYLGNLKNEGTSVPLILSRMNLEISNAIKKDGVRLYEHARAGESIEIASRKTTIHEFEITRIALPEIDFRVVCSKGTYIRSLAFDFGKAMQSGSHLTVLRRTKIGDYDVKNGVNVLDFEESLTSNTP